MGYTHYWYQRRELTASEWADTCEAFHTMLSQLPTHSNSAGGYYSDKPLALADIRVTNDYIAFNGVGELSCETMVLYRNYEIFKEEWETPSEMYPDETTWFQFCKTKRKPYDLLVVALLLAVTEIAPGWAYLRSDGDMQGDEWQPARDFLRNLKEDDEEWTR